MMDWNATGCGELLCDDLLRTFLTLGNGTGLCATSVSDVLIDDGLE
jgi:hypothetical protein